MRVLKNLPLRLVIPIFIILSFLLFNIFQFYLEKSKTFEAIKNTYVENAKIIGDSLQQTVEYFLVRQEKTLMEKVIVTYSAKEGVDYIAITDEKGKVLFSSRRGLKGFIKVKTEGCETEGYRVFCYFPLVGPDKERDILVFAFNMEREIIKAEAMIYQKFILHIAFFGLATFLLYLLLGNLVVKETENILNFLKSGDVRSLKIEGKNEFAVIKKAIRDAWDTIWRLANTDHLTGLYNRRYMENIYPSMAEEGNIIMAIIDLDNFKDVNDLFGHDFGDELLVQCSQRLKDVCDDEGFIAGRLGGDEFLILGVLPEGESPEEHIKRIKAKLSEKYSIKGIDVAITVSVGYSVVEGRNKPDFYELLKQCDIALYRGKLTTKNAIVRYSKEYEDREKRKRQVLLRIKDGLERGEFYLLYQPIYDVHTGKPIAYEALIRWENDYLGYVPPSEFIPYAEVSGLIVDIGRFVIRKAVEDIKRLKMPVHINLSARQLYDEGLIDYLKEVCEEHNVPRRMVIIELTESQNITMDSLLIAQILNIELEGFDISLDDFGTGYSNIQLLHEIRPKNLKIDMSIVKRLEQESDDSEQIILALVELANALGIDVIAEGVDTETKVNKLMWLGVSKMQGFYFSKPVPLEVALSLTRSSGA